MFPMGKHTLVFLKMDMFLLITYFSSFELFLTDDTSFLNQDVIVIISASALPLQLLYRPTIIKLSIHDHQDF